MVFIMNTGLKKSPHNPGLSFCVAQPGSLTPREVYSVTAYVLYLDGIVSESEVLNAKSLPKVKMPNRDGFVADHRSDTRTLTR